MKAPLSALLLLTTFGGCAMAPGIRLDDSEVSGRGRERGEPEYQVQPVTPALLQQLARSSAEAAAARRPDPNAAELSRYEYRISPLDLLSVVVWDHPELTSPTGQYRGPEDNGLPVYADGTMFYPFVGLVKVAGKTVLEVQQELTRQLRASIKQPQVSVRVAAFRGRRVEVTGEVKNPQTLPVTDVPLRVSDAVAKAGGFVAESSPSAVTLLRKGQAFPLDLMAYYEEGDVKQNWMLQDGDVVHVGHISRTSVYVFGEVKRMGTRPMPRGRLTLAQALGDSEGFDYVTMRPVVYVLRDRGAAMPEIFRVDVENAEGLVLAAQFPLQPRDVVFVATNELARFNRVLNQVAPLVNVIWQGWNMAATSKQAIGR